MLVKEIEEIRETIRIEVPICTLIGNDTFVYKD